MDQERMSILRMVAGGKITVEEAEQLLEALGESRAAVAEEAPAVEHEEKLEEDFFEEDAFELDTSPRTISVPEGTKLAVTSEHEAIVILGTEGSEIKVEGAPRHHYKVTQHEDKVEISTTRMDASINVHVPKTVRSVTAQSDLAEVTVRDLSADVKAESDTSGIRIHNVQGKIQAGTDTGPIELRGIKSSDIQAKTDTGEISVDMDTIKEGSVKLRTETGGISLGLPSDSAFGLSAVVKEIGNVRCDLPLEVSEQGSGFLRGTLNDGGASIQMAVDIGEIHVKAKESRQ